MASYAATILGANSSVGTGNNCPSNANDSMFRGWTQLIANGFISANWVRVADSGNINFATVTTPATASLSSGYDIFRMTDALNVAAPVYVKVEYGSGTTNTIPSIWLTIGSGSTGAGMVTGAASQRQQLTLSTQSTNAISSFISGDANRIHMALWSFSNATFGGTSVTTLAQAWYFSIERTKDATGADTTEGVLLVVKGAGSAAATSYNQQYWNSVTGSSGNEPSWGVLMPSINVAPTSAVQTAFYPIYHSKGVFVNPGMGTLCFIGSSTAGAVVPATEGCPLVVPMYGSNHTYMPLSALVAGPNLQGRNGNQGANTTYAMRYE
jgi:hypothetical protein